MALQWNVTFSDSVTVWSTGSVIKPGATKQKMETQCEQCERWVVAQILILIQHSVKIFSFFK